MKNFFSYSLILFFSSLFFISGIKEKKKIRNIHQIYNKNKTDTVINKLPDGHSFITNFNLSKHQKVKSISQDASGIMLFLTSKGVIFFDGMTEEMLYFETHPNLIKKDIQLDQFYIAERKGFGIVRKDKKGDYIYESISENKEENENFKQIITEKNKVWFVSNHKIASITPKNYKKPKIEYFNRNKTISGAFVFKNQLYFSEYDSGLYVIENDSAKLITNDTLFSNYKIIFNIPDKESIILGLENNKLYTFNGKTYKIFKASSDDYINESIITGGSRYTNDIIVVTTLNGGAILIDKNTGKTTHTINYRTGLPDDEIYASYSDRTNGLWLSHDYGISRVAFDIPVTNYSFYPGLQGKINYVKVFDSTLYVATGEGLFRLSQIKNYDEVEVATKKWIKSKTKTANNNYITENIITEESSFSPEENDTETDEEGFFNRWKKRRKKKNKEEESNIDESFEDTEENTDTHSTKNNNKPEKESYKTIYKAVTEYKKIYELHSVKYSYKKVEGINSKCKHLKSFSKGLLASTNSGLFFIQNNEIKTLIADAYIYNISGSVKDKVLYSATSKGLFKIYNSGKNISAEKITGAFINNKNFQKVFKVNDTIVWLSSLNDLFLTKIKGKEVMSGQQFKIETDQSEKLNIIKENNKIIFLASGNAYYYNEELKDVIEHSDYYQLLKKSNNIFNLTDTSILITKNNTVLKSINTEINNNYLKYAWLIDNIKSINFDEEENIWIVSRQNSIYKINNKETYQNKKFNIYIKNITDNKGNAYKNFEMLELESDYKNITVQLLSPYFLKKDFVKYFYAIDSENSDDFINFSSSQIAIPELSPGKHTIHFKAINDLNETSEVLILHVDINPPLWQTNIFIIGVFTIVLILISVIISVFYRRKQRKIKQYNEILELKVKERTAEIEKQNLQIQNQNTEIYEQYQKINTQNEEITGSIRYAGKIQRAALPNTEIQKKYLSGHFILYKPRDIVSGDFYWMTEAQNKLFIAAVDCTGHGVPGGFLSMLGISFLNEIVIDLNKKKKYIRAADILNILRDKIISTLSQQGDEITRDGMDIALAVIDKEKKLLNFAGANNPAYIIRDRQLTKIDADRMPVGYNKKLNDIKFKDKFVKILKDDIIYLFSDGYADQFGGSNGKKFNARRFRELLLHVQKYPMEKQKEIAGNVLKKWQQGHQQIDDILLIGIKI
ncbi:MAG: SpoIIE family protein phosphatase [Bacteroidales bacterium]|nr:SpoIIE family protein phosphatase [Bacteroidales bacterium]